MGLIDAKEYLDIMYSLTSYIDGDNAYGPDLKLWKNDYSGIISEYNLQGYFLRIRKLTDLISNL
jgi:hypothetical protein